MCHTCDERFLESAATLARKGGADVAPNPQVGALVVANERVVAEGYHARYGGPHAEAEALDVAGDAARGATLYCTLEPCSYDAPDKHQPPCTRRIIAAGISRVVIGQLDPNPRVRGNGVAILREAGVEVVVADEPGPFLRLNPAFNTWMASHRPEVHLKTAMSLDGRIATADGNSRWITDETARRRAHALRGEADAVAVGIGTVLADDPLLPTRLVAAPDARPVVFDSSLAIPLSSALVRGRPRDLIVVTAATEADRRRDLERRGVTVVPVNSTSGSHEEGGRVDVAEALVRLGELGIRSLLVEGGSRLVTSFVRRDLFDRMTAFVAPILLGAGIPAVGELGTASVADARRLAHVRWEPLGDQLVCSGYHPRWAQRVLAWGEGAARGGATAAHHYEPEVLHVHRTG